MLDLTTLASGGIPGVTVALVAFYLIFRFFWGGWGN